MNRQVRLSEADWLAAQRLHLRWDTSRWLRNGGVSVAALALGFYLWLDPSMSDGMELSGKAAVLGTVAAWAVGLWQRLVVMPQRLHRLYARYQAHLLPFDLSWNDECLTITTAKGRVDAPWDTFKRWRHDARMILLYTSNADFKVIPKRLFPGPGDAQGLLGLLAARIAKG